ncbi:Na+/H+ antiporter subunit E [Streptomyces macrosporus]|uniref:Na+/H+ antiporter subunit E n=1 Tax=Streptomyces macrosporus TaxID=44032 RepID=A0ABP5WBU7_9ACTN
MKSVETSADRGGGGLPRQAVRRWRLLVWLWLLWIVLWGSVSPVVLVTGLVVAGLVLLLFPLPPHTHRLTVHPLWAVAMVGHLLVDLVGSALTVAREALLRGPRARAAVLEARLEVDNDLLVTAAAQTTALTPGSLVLEIDRAERLFYVHALPVRDAAEAEDQRGDVRDAERWVVRAFGTAEDRRSLLRRDGRRGKGPR